VFSNFRRTKYQDSRRDRESTSRRGATKMKFLAMKFFIMKFLALAAVIAVLVAGSAVFVSNHPRAMTACAAGCE
jgi:hypothetical protein